MIWVNDNDLIVLPHWKSWFLSGNLPQMTARFGLVKYHNLPRMMISSKSSPNSLINARPQVEVVVVSLCDVAVCWQWQWCSNGRRGKTNRTGVL